eukprot:scaffold7336_cov88-Cylindrotheca_fusiformis.AAC.3
MPCTGHNVTLQQCNYYTTIANCYILKEVFVALKTGVEADLNIAIDSKCPDLQKVRGRAEQCGACVGHFDV